MRDFRDAKTMAQSLRSALDDRSITITHSDALELISRSFGFDNWNILAAQIEAARPAEVGPAQTSALCHCSFCGKSQLEVERIIAGPSSFICNECIELCNDITDSSVITELLRHNEGGEEKLAAYLRARTPEQLTEYRPRLDRWIGHLDWSIGEAARALGEPVKYAPGGLPGVRRGNMTDWPKARIEAHREDLRQRRDAALKARAAADRILGGPPAP